MSEQQSADIQQLRSLTQQLLNSASAADWDAATAIEADRRPLMYQVFGRIVPGDHGLHQALLNEILSADREIIRLAKQRHAELAKLLRQMNQGRSAHEAYTSNSR